MGQTQPKPPFQSYIQNRVCSIPSLNNLLCPLWFWSSFPQHFLHIFSIMLVFPQTNFSIRLHHFLKCSHVVDFKALLFILDIFLFRYSFSPPSVLTSKVHSPFYYFVRAFLLHSFSPLIIYGTYSFLTTIQVFFGLGSEGHFLFAC